MQIDDYDEKNVTVQDVLAVHETDKAIKVDFGELGEQWIPKSQIHEDSEVYEDGHHGDLIISRWIAKQKGLL
jgi:hypothetical protein